MYATECARRLWDGERFIFRRSLTPPTNYENVTDPVENSPYQNNGYAEID